MRQIPLRTSAPTASPSARDNGMNAAAIAAAFFPFSPLTKERKTVMISKKLKRNTEDFFSLYSKKVLSVYTFFS